MPLAVNELWDAHNGNFVDDMASMAKLIQDAAQDRQGRVTSSPLHGQNLLDQWYANFSQCRVSVERHEIANIIFEVPTVETWSRWSSCSVLETLLSSTCHHLPRSLDRACIWMCTH